MMMDLIFEVDSFVNSSPREYVLYICLLLYVVYFQVHSNSSLEQNFAGELVVRFVIILARITSVFHSLI